MLILYKLSLLKSDSSAIFKVIVMAMMMMVNFFMKWLTNEDVFFSKRIIARGFPHHQPLAANRILTWSEPKFRLCQKNFH